MKPRNKFEQAVLAQSKHLRPITKAQRQWAFRECIDHYAYRLPKGKTTCMDCGHSWQMIEPTERCTCPQCGADLEVITTRARKLKQRQYFTVLTTSGGYQVLRMYLLIAGMEKGYQASSSVMEIGQYWWDERGRQSIVAVERTMGHYIDSFAYYSPMAIRRDNEAYRFVAHCPLCPKVKLSDTLKRNGFEGKCYGIAPTSLIPALLTDSRAETLLKAGRTEHLAYFLSCPRSWDAYWPAYKITLRWGYDITDIALWCDYVDMLRSYVRTRTTPTTFAPRTYSKPTTRYTESCGPGKSENKKSTNDRRRRRMKHDSKNSKPHSLALPSLMVPSKSECWRACRSISRKDKLYAIAYSPMSITSRRRALSYRHALRASE